MGGLIITVQVLALFLSTPMEVSGMKTFEDPTQLSNVIYYMGLILVFTLFVLIAIKKNMKFIISFLIYFAIISTLYYVFYALFTLLPPLSGFEAIVSILVSVGVTVLLYKYPEWYLIDLVGICTAGGVSALIGISLSVIPVVFLLMLLAIYDAISVYRTKHMITMAEGIMDLKLPILFVIPKHSKYSFLQEKVKKGEEREAFFYGPWRCHNAHASCGLSKHFYTYHWRKHLSSTRSNVRYPCRVCSAFCSRNERKTTGRTSFSEFRSNLWIFYRCSTIRGINYLKG